MHIHGIVKYWELAVTDGNGERVTKHRDWNDATDAFTDAIAREPYSAAVYACSGKYGDHRIQTWSYGNVDSK